MSKSKKKKYQNNRHTFNTEHYLFIALIIVVALIPLLVRITPVDYDLSGASWDTGQTTYYDNFSYVKANAIKFMGLIMTLLLLRYLSQNADKSLTKSPVIWLASLSIVTTIISSISSMYPYFVSHGFIERYESVWVVICYMIFFLSAYLLTWDEKKIKYLFNGFWASNLLLSLVGLGQLFGKNILVDPAFRTLITSFKMGRGFELVDKLAGSNTIVQTLYNPNYVGFYIALSLPIFASLALYEKNLKKKIALTLTSLLILINLLGSSSRGGLVGVCVALLFWLILNRHLIFKNKFITVAFFAVIIVIFIGFESFSGGGILNRLKYMVNIEPEQRTVKAIYTEDNNIVLESDDNILKIVVTGREGDDWNFHTEVNGKSITTPIDDQNRMIFESDDFKNIYLFYQSFSDQDYYHLTLQIMGRKWSFNYDDQGHLTMRNIYGNYVTLSPIKRIVAWDGYERVGSSRIYIWSRLLPKVMDKPLFGYGPDTAAIVFPQEDYLGKIYAFYTNNMLADKPHNLYLQYAIHLGLIGLGIFLALMVAFYASVIKYLKKHHFSFDSPYASGLATGLTAYFIAGFFNDSTVHVSPVFWVMFGLGFAYFKMHNASDTFNG